MAGSPLEIAGAHKRTGKGDVDWYYDNDGNGWANKAAAIAGVPVAVRERKTVLIDANQVDSMPLAMEYWWKSGTADTDLVVKTIAEGAKFRLEKFVITPWFKGQYAIVDQAIYTPIEDIENPLGFPTGEPGDQWRKVYDSAVPGEYVTNSALDLLIESFLITFDDHENRITLLEAAGGGGGSGVTFEAYYGWKDTNTPLTADEILQSPYSVTVEEGTDILADYRANTQPQFLWMAHEDTEPVKTHWYAGSGNGGSIGGGTNLFVDPVWVDGFWFYIAGYKTQNTQAIFHFTMEL